MNFYMSLKISTRISTRQYARLQRRAALAHGCQAGPGRHRTPIAALWCRQRGSDERSTARHAAAHGRGLRPAQCRGAAFAGQGGQLCSGFAGPGAGPQRGERLKYMATLMNDSNMTQI